MMIEKNDEKVEIQVVWGDYGSLEGIGSVTISRMHSNSCSLSYKLRLFF